MRADELLKFVRHQPFRPFRVLVSDGATYDIRHPELIYITQSLVVIAVAQKGGIPEETAFCDPTHITRVELLNGSRGGKPRRRVRSK